MKKIKMVLKTNEDDKKRTERSHISSVRSGEEFTVTLEDAEYL